MKRWNSQSLSVVYLGLLLAGVFAGCSSRQEPSETLVLCGNHSCGNLTMVTSDTSSDGYQYLEPALSPDGQYLVFTGDWSAIPEPGHYDPIPQFRQIFLIPVRMATGPAPSLVSTGAELILFNQRVMDFGGSANSYQPKNEQKGSPIWQDDNNVICWIKTSRGSRLFRFNPHIYFTNVELLYKEPDDNLVSGRFWQHMEPALSPDGQWLAFTRFGFRYPDSLSSYTQQSAWVLSMATAGEGRQNLAFPVTTENALIGGLEWSRDGSRLAFHASLDMVGEVGTNGTELFTIAFDTTGLAADGGVLLNRDLRRLTYTPVQAGDPLSGIQNTDPVYSGDGQEIYFVSSRRAPSITLHDRNIWRIPADGRLEPQLLFFSREDDVDPFVPVGTSKVLILSSAMGFPTEMLDRLEQEAIIRITQENPGLSETEIELMASQERQQLEYFAGVISHLFVFSDW